MPVYTVDLVHERIRQTLHIAVLPQFCWYVCSRILQRLFPTTDQPLAYNHPSHMFRNLIIHPLDMLEGLITGNNITQGSFMLHPTFSFRIETISANSRIVRNGVETWEPVVFDLLAANLRILQPNFLVRFLELVVEKCIEGIHDSVRRPTMEARIAESYTAKLGQAVSDVVNHILGPQPSSEVPDIKFTSVIIRVEITPRSAQ